MDKIKNQLQISVSNDGFVDEGDGIISFPNGLTITDDTVMRSGTRYDIDSLDIDNYPGQLTGDHVDSLGTLIGKVIGVAKSGNRVVVSAIKYAVNENPYARLAYNLLVGGFSNSFSIETLGPMADGNGSYRNHELVGLSQVVVPNNYNAKLNQFNEIVHNSLERSQQDGFDTTGIEEKIYSQLELVSSDTVEKESMAKDKDLNASEVEETQVLDTAENEEQLAVTENDAEVVETEVVVAGDDEVVIEEVEDKTEVEAQAETETKTETTVEKTENGTWIETTTVTTTSTSEYVESEEEKAERKAREARWEEEAKAEKESDATVTVRIETENGAEDAVAEEAIDNNTNKNEENLEMTAEQIAEIVANAIKPLTEELVATKELAQNALDAQAKEPEFEEVAEVANSYDAMSAEELFAKQLSL